MMLFLSRREFSTSMTVLIPLVAKSEEEKRWRPSHRTIRLEKPAFRAHLINDEAWQNASRDSD